MKIEIGMEVEFIAFNVRFRGTVMDIEPDKQCYVAVIAHRNMFCVPIGAVIPVAIVVASQARAL